MNNNYIGYARVSTVQQNEDRQLIALREYGVPPDAIFTDKQSGRDFERKNYKRMIKKLKKGKVLVVKSIDRLGRNYDEIIEQWRYITKEIGADIKVIDMELLDTTTHKNLLGTFISDLILQLLSFVSQNERENIRQRQAEGIAAAKARGVRFGRPTLYPPDKYLDIFIRYRNKEISQKTAMHLIGCGNGTFYRLYHTLKSSGKLH